MKREKGKEGRRIERNEKTNAVEMRRSKEHSENG